ncbi:MAG TPA: bifunctional isocitrate dehydrogenase kinase/phosphatase [Gaiellaceae bacterium]|nr:bifunctional isocitrate dehydrogenase kinase/phosphatase [Gaiellaceae bacterium]
MGTNETQATEAAPEGAAQQIAAVLIEGFDKHYRLFRATSAHAKELFEAAAWTEQQHAVQERVRFYDDRVRECTDRLRREFDVEALSAEVWRDVKLYYIGLLVEHSQPELAETFFNSVITRILRNTYHDNDLIFVRAAISTEYIESDPPIYRSYYPKVDGEHECFTRLFRDFGWSRPFADLDRDVGLLLSSLANRPGGPWTHLEPNYQIQVLNSAFYRNKAAYVFGKLVNGHDELPFVVAVLNDAANGLEVDAILLEPQQINLLFSLSRAYFMVDMEVPSGYVEFLRSMTPLRAGSELYTMLGLGKQGKTLFFRELLRHLHHSLDQFVEAPGIRGQVMLVFTLPSYPYVFKLIRDSFGFGKDTDRETIRSKFTMVKHVDRVGRLADTLEFVDLALPRERFSAKLLAELHELAPSMISDGDPLVIHHCYVERRMVPLNIYLDRASPRELESAVIDYGNAIRDLVAANIFPGDMLWRNFGVTSYGRVVFYDYDEIEYLRDVNFRQIPPAGDEQSELAAEPWYGVLRNDVFPEEFATFLLSDPRLREIFLRHHAELLEPAFWQAAQRRIESGELLDFFPYPESLRFRSRNAAA